MHNSGQASFNKILPKNKNQYPKTTRIKTQLTPPLISPGIQQNDSEKIKSFPRKKRASDFFGGKWNLDFETRRKNTAWSRSQVNSEYFEQD